MPIAAEMGVSASGPEPSSAPESGIRDHRALALVAAVGLFAPAQQAAGAIVRTPALGLIGSGLFGVALLFVCLIARAGTLARLERLDWWLLAIGIGMLVVGQAAVTHGRSYYVTDEAALIHAGTFTLMHGHDPYGANLSWAFTRYGVASRAYLTYLMNGGTVHSLGYPPLMLIAALPIMALDQHAQVVTIVAGAGLCVAAAATFIALPRRLRPLAVIIYVDIPVLLAYATDGLSSVLMLVLMTVCVYRWAAVGRTGPTGQGLLGRGGAAQAVCLGLAAATNQLAWFIAPFLLAGIFLSARTRVGGRPARAIVARYLAIALLTFAAINAPFIAWGPGAWLSGVFAPITQHAVPYGQGLIGLTTLDRIGGGALEFYAYGAALLYLALLGLFWTDFPRLGRCVLIFPVAALYASERSLAEYWLVPLGLVVVSILCSGIDQAASHGTDGLDRVLRHLPAGRLSPTAASVVARCALFAPAVACLLVAMATPGPLELTVLSAHDARGTGAVDRLVVMVRNSSSRSLEPRFAVNNLGLIGGFWPVASGPVELAPGMLARYVLNAPSAQVEPPPGSRYLLQAVTAAPQTISSSPRISAPSHS